MLKSLMAKLGFGSMLAPVVVTATGNSSSVDVKDYGALCVLVHAGAMAFDGSNLLDLKLQHSDDDSTFTDCAADDVFEGEDMANGIVKKLDAAGDADKVHPLFYLGNKQYVRVRYEETGTVSVALGITAVKGHPKALPQN